MAGTTCRWCFFVVFCNMFFWVVLTCVFLTFIPPLNLGT